MIKLTLISLIKFICFGFINLHLRRNRVGKIYQIKKADNYKIFRETISTKIIDKPLTVLVVGFRLKLIDANSFLHWIFQRVCILTTPFWGGFKGFKTKLWMVNPSNKNYLGVYEWYGMDNAKKYIDFLIPILKFFSVSGSVRHSIYRDTSIDKFLR